MRSGVQDDRRGPGLHGHPGARIREWHGLRGTPPAMPMVRPAGAPWMPPAGRVHGSPRRRPAFQQPRIPFGRVSVAVRHGGRGCDVWSRFIERSSRSCALRVESRSVASRIPSVRGDAMHADSYRRAHGPAITLGTPSTADRTGTAARWLRVQSSSEGVRHDCEGSPASHQVGSIAPPSRVHRRRCRPRHRPVLAGRLGHHASIGALDRGDLGVSGTAPHGALATA